ncbi:DUF1080 domain-containing protein [Prolixibacteraceae bacterium JC049]|nr:DUF1080 domain-containing protein [Prolixibacteraceae bacterium JC049]
MNKAGLIILFFFIVATSIAQSYKVDFGSNKWKVLGDAQIEQQNGETITTVGKGIGFGYLDDFNFTNGTIECDLYAEASRAYVGLTFRIATPNDFECIYFQPHTSGKWDAVQYDPIFNQSATWQLYNGKGFQTKASIPTKKWFHVKIEVKDFVAKVFLNHNIECVMETPLQHTHQTGYIGIFSYHAARFKNLKIKKYNSFSLMQPKNSALPNKPNTIPHWKVSSPYNGYGQNEDIKHLHAKVQKWHDIKPKFNSLVNLNRYFSKTNSQNTVIAKTTINSTKQQIKQLAFGYSDKIRIFLNGTEIFKGDNSYYESASYDDRGYVLPNHKSIDLPLQQGSNELILEISEDKFGWGFITLLSNFDHISFPGNK